jgi:hypothetical protein
MKRAGARLTDVDALCRSVSGGPHAVRFNEDLVKDYDDQ